MDWVVDIGANDGTLLCMYSNRNLWTMGIEPAPNIEKTPYVDVWIRDYFSKEALEGKTPDYKAKVVTAIAMFYDLPDPNKFVEDVKSILSDDGIFVVQFTDLLSMFKACAFDNICHEHLEYYRLEDVMKLLRSHGLDVIDVSYNDVNGGSIRITACHDGAYFPSYSVVSYLTKERNYLKDFTIKDFSKSIELACSDLQVFLDITFLRKEKVFLLGASTKGNTLLQICEITNEFVPYAAEVNKEKLGLRTVGSNINIISEDDALEMKPDYFIVPVWHFKENLLSNDKIRNYIKGGGHLVFPLPVFHIIGKEDLKDD
jgi:hypothetical protein